MNKLFFGIIVILAILSLPAIVPYLLMNLGLQNMKFEDIAVGTKFFDTYTGDYFIKTGCNNAEVVSGGDYLEGSLCTFGYDEEVEL